MCAAAAVLALLTFAHVLGQERADPTVAAGTLRGLDDSDDAAQQALEAAEQQSELESEQQAEEQNEQAQQQAIQDDYQAEQSDPQVIQDAQQGG